MKIGVVGCGALGSYYGARLAAAGEEVHFLLRSDFEVVRRAGVTVQSPEGDFHVHPRCAISPKEIGLCDLALIGLKTTANDQFTRLLPSLAGRDTLVLTLQNGLGNEEQLAALLGPDNVLGGLCFVCLNRLRPGVIQHVAHGRIVLGEFQRPALPRTQRIAEMFRHAGVPCDVTDNLARAHWEKLVWNVPFNGLGVASAAGLEAVLSGRVNSDAPLNPCLTTDVLLNDPRWERVVRELMREIIATASALGLSVTPAWEEEHIQRTRIMGAYRASTLIDFERGQSLELESLFLKPLALARQAGVSTPRLEALCNVLAALDSKKRISNNC